jgi:sodium/pantothenate symporter
MISSGLVRDIYQRTINPQVSEKTVKWMTYLITALVGIGVTLVALRSPPQFLQYIIVFTGSFMSFFFV